MDKRYSARAQSFMVQYISLFLILLTFIAGSFCRAGLKEASTSTPPIVVEKLKSPDVSWLQSELAVEDLDDDELETIGSILLNHDLIAEITLRPSDDIERDLLSSQKVRQSLEARGVPESTFKIYVQSGSEPWVQKLSAKVRWYDST